MSLRLVFQSKDFVAADKPAGWLTVPSRLGVDDPRRCLGLELERTLGGRVFPVHRLDVVVSGLVLFARTEEAHRRAGAWFESRRVRKWYRAFTEGGPPDGIEPGVPVEWRSVLLRGKKRAYESPRGKPCLTVATWEGEADFRGRTLGRWLLEPKTGRPHQLRYELFRHGHPIAGDVLYGAPAPLDDPDEIALRSLRLDLSACDRAGLVVPDLLEVDPR